MKTLVTIYLAISTGILGWLIGLWMGYKAGVEDAAGLGCICRFCRECRGEKKRPGILVRADEIINKEK